MDCGGGSDRCLTSSLDYKDLTVETKYFEKSCSTKATCDAGQKLKIQYAKKLKGQHANGIAAIQMAAIAVQCL